MMVFASQAMKVIPAARVAISVIARVKPSDLLERIRSDRAVARRPTPAKSIDRASWAAVWRRKVTG